MEGYEASTYGDRFAEVYDDWYGEVTDAAACTIRLRQLLAASGGGPLLELGVGTGRLALPLAAAGVEVHGLDASAAMLERLRAKPGGDGLTLTCGDMAALPLHDRPRFGVVLAAFNTFFNLPTEAAQRRCLEQVASLLRSDGCLVLEAFVPAEPGATTGGALTPRHLTVDEVVLSASLHDPDAQTITGQHIHLTEHGTRLRPWHLRYATPEQLDAMAADAGLALVERHADWLGAAFGPDSGVHVSVYRPSNVRSVRQSADRQ